MTTPIEALSQRITDYLTGGGLFNPEIANHAAVRDLLIDCRAAFDQRAQPAAEPAERAAFEVDARALGFDTTRRDNPNVEPWGDYDDEVTGHRWGGWLAAKGAQPAAEPAYVEGVKPIWETLDELGKSVPPEAWAQPAAEPDALDARRYRWLRQYGMTIYNEVFNDDDYTDAEANTVEGWSAHLDAAIEAAIAAKP